MPDAVYEACRRTTADGLRSSVHLLGAMGRMQLEKVIV